MAKVTLTDPAENPAATVPDVQKATVQDAQGRSITLKKPGAAGEAGFFEAAGPARDEPALSGRGSARCNSSARSTARRHHAHHRWRTARRSIRAWAMLACKLSAGRPAALRRGKRGVSAKKSGE
jgi:hypothetical protein